MQQSIKIGTRGSPLALAQAHDVKNRLLTAHADLSEDQINIIVIKTSGDKILDKPLITAGGKGLFTKEIEDALLAGEIDCAVHSSKDMPTTLPDGLCLSIFLPREDARDAFISNKFSHFQDLPKGAVLGTSSLRRRALALRARPDLKVINFRGNVQSRLRKLAEEEADATFLALAGLNRLNMATVATEKLTLNDFLPAPAQGAVTVEIREDDTIIAERLSPLHCPDTAIAVTAERAFLAALDGSCRTPIAAYAVVQNGELILQAKLLSVDGQQAFDRSTSGHATITDAEKLGHDIGLDIRAEAGHSFFQQLVNDVEANII